MTKGITGMWSHLGQSWGCSEKNCDERLGVGSKVYALGDGTVFCEYHGQEKDAEVLAARRGEAVAAGRTCVICSEPVDDKPAGQQTCSRKCGATLKRRNAKPAKEAMQPEASGF